MSVFAQLIFTSTSACPPDSQLSSVSVGVCPAEGQGEGCTIRVGLSSGEVQVTLST